MPTLSLLSCTIYPQLVYVSDVIWIYELHVYFTTNLQISRTKFFKGGECNSKDF